VCYRAVPAVDLLFCEELGFLLEITEDSVHKVTDAYTQGGVSCKRIGRCFHNTSTNNVRYSSIQLLLLSCSFVMLLSLN